MKAIIILFALIACAAAIPSVAIPSYNYVFPGTSGYGVVGYNSIRPGYLSNLNRFPYYNNYYYNGYRPYYNRPYYTPGLYNTWNSGLYLDILKK